MGFFKDFKEDLTQAVDELTDSADGKPAKKDSKKEFGKKNRKSGAVKVTDTYDNSDRLFTATQDSQERSDSEQAIWDELKADYSVDQPGTQDGVLGEDDVTEELVEIEETRENEAGEADNSGNGGEYMARNYQKTEVNLVQNNEIPVPVGDISDEVGIVTSGMTVLGNVYSNGHMEIYGSVEGDVEINGSLRLIGTIIGNVKASEVIIESGKIKGNISCGGGVSIATGCVVMGSILAGTGAGIAGAVKGDIDVHGPVTLDPTAIVKGNIKSQSVQMANGAMVDGMCSQCYSDVDLSSFFDGM